MQDMLSIFSIETLKEALVDADFYNEAKIKALRVVIDSRLVNEGDMFVAIKGKNFNAHDFIPEVIAKKASCIIDNKNNEEYQELCKKNDIAYIVHKDTTKALQELAIHRRKNDLSATKVIAITGSSGKTTVTQMLGKVLSNYFHTHYTYKNYNNHIGLPLTILSAPLNIKVLVLEMGMNHKNEIDILSRIANPDIAVIINVCDAHIGNFEDGIEGIIEAKCEIFNGLKPGGIILLNKDSEHYTKMANIAKAKGIKNIFQIGSNNSSHVFIDNIKINNFNITEYDLLMKDSDGWRTIRTSFNSIMPHNAFLTAFVFAVARLLKIDLEAVANNLVSLPVVEGRGNIEYIFFDGKKICTINDTYNSSIHALTSAVSALKSFDGKRLVCVVGDIGEIGDDSGEIHKNLVSIFTDNKIDKVITVGKKMQNLYNNLPEALKVERHYHNIGSLSKNIKSLLEDDDVVLFKASNLMQLGKVLDKLHY